MENDIRMIRKRFKCLKCGTKQSKLVATRIKDVVCDSCGSTANEISENEFTQKTREDLNQNYRVIFDRQAKASGSSQNTNNTNTYDRYTNTNNSRTNNLNKNRTNINNNFDDYNINNDTQNRHRNNYNRSNSPPNRHFNQHYSNQRQESNSNNSSNRGDYTNIFSNIFGNVYDSFSGFNPFDTQNYYGNFNQTNNHQNNVHNQRNNRGYQRARADHDYNSDYSHPRQNPGGFFDNFFSNFGINFPFGESPFMGRILRHNFDDDIFDPTFEFFGSTFNNFFRDNYSSNFRSNFGNIGDIGEIFEILRNQTGYENQSKSTSEKAIKNLKRFKMNEKYCKKSKDGNLEYPNCCICISDINKNEETVLLPCGHMFHWPCVLEWLKKNNTCPVCRFELQAESR